MTEEIHFSDNTDPDAAISKLYQLRNRPLEALSAADISMYEEADLDSIAKRIPLLVESIDYLRILERALSVILCQELRAEDSSQRIRFTAQLELVRMLRQTQLVIGED